MDPLRLMKASTAKFNFSLCVYPLLETQKLVSCRHSVYSRRSSTLWLSVARTFYQLHILTDEIVWLLPTAEVISRTCNMVPLHKLPHNKEALIRFVLTTAVFNMSLFNLLHTHCQHMLWKGEYMSYICGLNRLQERLIKHTAVFQIKFQRDLSKFARISWKAAMENYCTNPGGWGSKSKILILKYIFLKSMKIAPKFGDHHNKHSHRTWIIPINSSQLELIK